MAWEGGGRGRSGVCEAQGHGTVPPPTHTRELGQRQEWPLPRIGRRSEPAEPRLPASRPVRGHIPATATHWPVGLSRRPQELAKGPQGLPQLRPPVHMPARRQTGQSCPPNGDQPSHSTVTRPHLAAREAGERNAVTIVACGSFCGNILLARTGDREDDSQQCVAHSVRTVSVGPTPLPAAQH